MGSVGGHRFSPGSDLAKGRFVKRIFQGLMLACLLAGPATAQDVSPRLAQLHDSLRLTADQEGPWRDYVAAIAPDPQALARHRATRQLLPQVPTPRRVALIDAAMAADSADLHRQGVAVLAFYDHLSPDQQRTFDRAPAPSVNDRQSGESHGAGSSGRLVMPPTP